MLVGGRIVTTPTICFKVVSCPVRAGPKITVNNQALVLMHLRRLIPKIMLTL